MHEHTLSATANYKTNNIARHILYIYLTKFHLNLGIDTNLDKMFFIAIEVN